MDETHDRITEVLARAWITCDPNRGGTDPDALMTGLSPSSTLNGKPSWQWFVPRAVALRDFLSENGLVVRPKEK